MTELLSGPFKYVIIFFVALIIIYVPVTIMMTKKNKKKKEELFAQNPNAAKLYTQTGATRGVNVLSVNSAPPVVFNETIGCGILLQAGANAIEAEYEWSRPGVLHKTVTTVMGPATVNMVAEAGKAYQINFDTKTEDFTVSEREAK